MKTSLEKISEEITWSEEVNEKLKVRGYVIGQKIGFGSFSAVFKCTKNGNPAAVKVIDLKRASPAYRDKFFPRELKVIQSTKHRHIVQTLDVYIDNSHSHNSNNIASKVFIFMTLAKYDLLTVIERSKERKIPEIQSRHWMRQVASGLKYLHYHMIAHRDMKVENVLIDFQNNALISDFGFVKTFPNTNSTILSIKNLFKAPTNTVLSETYCGSIQYASPEILLNQPYNPFPADIWSFGVLIYASLTGKMIFDGSNREEILSEQNKVHELIKVTNEISVTGRDLLHAMMQVQSKDRFIIDQVLSHDWMKPMRESSRSSQSIKSN